jgi:hypothetical protein
LAHAFEVNRRILPEGYRQENRVYGLMNYIKSLDRIAHGPSEPAMAAFPAHRLFYGGQFNMIHSSCDRAKEIIQFHIDRCRDILNILDDKPASIEEIAIRHFPLSRLTGTGRRLAQTEILAHLEIMEECGDICWAGVNGDKVQPTGSETCLSVIGAHLSG